MKKQEVNYLKKVHAESVVKQVINTLTDAMVNRQLRPGDKLPTELELAENLGVGRNSVREAIKILEYLGVVEIRRAEGTFVSEGFSESMIDPMIYGVILDRDNSYDNLMELRELMEVGVMELAMIKCTSSDLNALKEKLDNMYLEIEKGIENIEKIFQADNEFHQEICNIGANPIVDKINGVVRVLTHSIRFNTVYKMIETGNGRELFDAHEKIYDMINCKSCENINQAVRKTYFIGVISDNIND